MNLFPVVIDNDSLSHLSFIDSKYPVFNQLRNIFSAIHVPIEVLREFETDHHKNPDRKKVIDSIYSHNNFLRKCASFETIIKTMISTEKGIDKGEAGAIAQHLRIQARYLITEDISAQKRINSLFPHVKIIKTKHVLSILDLNGYITNWAGCIGALHKRRPLTSGELRKAYQEMAMLYGINLSKDRLSEKTGFKKLGLKI